MDKDFPPVHVEQHGPVAIMTLNRPERLNAFDVVMHECIRHELTAIERTEEIGAVIITGAGRGFCSGQDLKERQASFAAGEVPNLQQSVGEFYNPLISRLSVFPVPVIAAVNGLAFGAGAALALACDIAIAARSARFQLSFVDVGLGPDSGVSWFLPRAVGRQRAASLLLDPRPLSAEEAVEMGLVAQCVDDESLNAEALDIAMRIVGRSREAIRMTRKLLRDSACASLANALDAERASQAYLGATMEYRSAITQFGQKFQRT